MTDVAAAIDGARVVNNRAMTRLVSRQAFHIPTEMKHANELSLAGEGELDCEDIDTFLNFGQVLESIAVVLVPLRVALKNIL